MADQHVNRDDGDPVENCVAMEETVRTETVSTSTTVTKVESYTEQFHAEYVVEQAIMECNLKESLKSEVSDKNDECKIKSESEENNECKIKAESEENNECKIKSESEENNECKIKTVDESSQEKEVLKIESPDVSVCTLKQVEKDQNAEDGMSECPVKKEVKRVTISEDVACSKESKEGSELPDSEQENGDSLYPNVVVQSETKEPEMIEIKELSSQRKGSRFSISSQGASRKGSAAFVAEKDIDTILADVKETLMAVRGSLFEKPAEELRVAVIGAGPAGLCAARHLIAEGIEAEVYEQCPDIGGTWVYTEEAHAGSHVFPLHSSLYHDLWTNLPKETMQYPDFPYREEGTSYLPSEKVLQYLVDYADNFNLHPVIKLKHQVKRVAPLGNYWSVTVEDVLNKREEVLHFDAVMVCSGPNTIPVYPAIDGLAKFSGKQLHSRDYRRAETYTGKRVLVVGLGPSGLDITYQLQPTAKKVFLSHNRTKVLNMTFPDGVVVKPKVKSLLDKTVTFEDDSEEEVDVIIYCTGYTYNFPFLAPECGLIVDQNITPLFKHLINIEHPTMCIVGLPKYCPHQYMVDYQVRAFLNILLGRCKLPPKEEMLKDLESDREQRISEGQRKKDFHKLGQWRTKAYMDDLTTLGKLEPVPPVLYKLFSEAFMRAVRDFKDFRKYIYTILDNENYKVEPLDDGVISDSKGDRTIESLVVKTPNDPQK